MEKIMHKTYVDQLEDDIDIESVLKYNNLSYRIIEEMEKATEKTIEFWLEVKSNSDKSKIYESAVQISNSIRDIKSYYTEMIDNLGFKDINFFKLFCDFLEKIIFHEQYSFELREKLISIEIDIDNLSQNENEKVTSFFNLEDIGSVVISGKLSEIGKILSVNLKFCSIFKYESSQLLKNSINKIMPQYISQYHDNFIKRYMETAKKHILDQDRIVFGLLSTGFIRPILIQIKLIPNLEDSIRYIGLVKKMKKTDQFFYTSDYTKHVSTSFILCNSQGNLYGITKNVCENFGIPPNMLLNYKGNSDQTKILNIRSIFPEVKFDEDESLSRLKSENGCQIKLDTRSLKNFYEDFKETVLEGKSKTFKFLNTNDHELDNIFAEHDILLFMYNISFNSEQVNSKVFKFVKIPYYLKLFPNKSISIDEQNFDVQVSIVDNMNKMLNSLQKEPLVKTSSSALQKAKLNVDKDKNNYIELNKYKQNLFSYNYPKQVKVFILFVVFVLSFFITVSIIEMILTIKNANQISSFFEMWGNNIRKSLYFSSILSYFHNLALFDNNLYTNVLFPNDSKSFRNYIINKIDFHINKTIDLSNNLTYLINSFDESISYLYNNKTILTKNLQSNLSITNEYESLSYLEINILLKISKLLKNDTLSLDKNTDILYNSLYFSPKIDNLLLRDIFYVLENSFYIYRFNLESLQYNLDSILFSGKLFETNMRESLVYSTFVICFIILVIFFIILSSITNYKIKILTIFFLIDKKWSDIIIRRCRKYLAQSREFLQKDNRKIKDKNFFDEKDEVEYLENEIRKEEEDKMMREKGLLERENESRDGEDSLVRLTNNNPKNLNYNACRTNNMIDKNDRNVSIDSKRVKSNPNTQFLKTQKKKNGSYYKSSLSDNSENSKKNKNNLNQTLNVSIAVSLDDNDSDSNNENAEENDEESKNLEHSISNFRRTKWINSLKIFFLLILLCIYYLIVLLMNKNFNSDFQSNAYYLTLISGRGWNFNNLLLYYRGMLIQGRKISNYSFIDESGLYKYSDLDALDLYSLYYNKSSKTENTIQLIYNQESNLLRDFINIDNILNSKDFCSSLIIYDQDFKDVTENYCQKFKALSDINGLSNYIGFITNYCYNNFYLYSNKEKSLKLDLNTIISKLKEESLAIHFEVNQIIIFQAFLLELRIQSNAIDSYLNYYYSCTMIRISFFFLLIIVEVIFFIYLANLLKKLINEDKAILTIIPSEAISLNEKIKNAFQYL